jgi:hypothetical protein
LTTSNKRPLSFLIANRHVGAIRDIFVALFVVGVAGAIVGVVVVPLLLLLQ